MRYLSLCSGIEAASVAWRPLGWEPVAFAEIEPFPCAVLAHHYPNVPNLGDISKIDGKKYRGAVDLIVGGTPCQDFSIAGKRAGMAGERSGLAREFVRLLSEVRPRWFVWENVPGVFSTNGGCDFRAIIGAFEECGHSLAWRVLDAQFFGVPQRRRRVFVVGHLGNDWRPAATVLFERESLRRDTAARGKKGQSLAACLKGGPGSRGWEMSAEGNYTPAIVEQAMSCKWAKGSSGPAGDEHHNLVAVTPINLQVATRHQALGRGTGFGVGEEGDPAFTVSSAHAHAVAYQNGISGTLCASGAGMERTSGSGQEVDMLALSRDLRVRRLTPRECERLQGFPDDYTLIEYRGKPAADGPRYRALGNAMAVPVMRWIGQRIERAANSACGPNETKILKRIERNLS